MNLRALAIYLGARRIGVLVSVHSAKGADGENIVRFFADDSFARDRTAPTLSLSLRTSSFASQGLLWATVEDPRLNGATSARGGGLLPSFFQNLLPEGAQRRRLAELRQCDPNDPFELLGATGNDLPGNVFAFAVTLTADEAARYLALCAKGLGTPEEDAQGEAPVVTTLRDPLPESVSLAGVQPKVGVLKQGSFFVGRTRGSGATVIAKLPVESYPLLPQVEELSLRMAASAGVRVVTAALEPMSSLAVDHGLDLGSISPDTCFLAVQRYDRVVEEGEQPLRTNRHHAEDFAQVLGYQPENKYSGSYLEVALTLMAMPSLGEAAVHELLRRILVNEMLGNADMHLKNMGLLYPDGRTPVLPPAYDIVAYSAYSPRKFRALRLFPGDASKPRVRPSSLTSAQRNAEQQMSPQALRRFCSIVGIPEKPAAAVLAQTARKAFLTWPILVQDSGLLPAMKSRLLTHFYEHPAAAALLRRENRAKSRGAEEAIEG